MSVKDFFAFANIKQTVIEFLKNRSDFETLPARNKKPFRGHINRYYPQPANQSPAKEIAEQPMANSANDPYSDYFVSDGFNSIKCHFTEVCKETFGRMYPSSIKIYNIVNMLICIQSYSIVLRNKDYDLTKQTLQPSDLVTELLRQTYGRATDLEIVLVIDELRVISFDRFQVKLPASVQYEDQVRVYLAYMKHFLQKIKLIAIEFGMPDIATLGMLPG